MTEPAADQPIEGGPDQSDARSRRWRAWGGLLLLAVVVVILIWLFLNSIAVVPNTVGMTRARSAELIGNAGFTSSVATVTAAGRLAGRVVAQAPTGGWYFKFWPVHVDVGAGVGTGPVTLTIPPSTEASGDYGLAVNSGNGAEQMPFDAEEVSPLYTPQTTVMAGLMPDVQNSPESRALSAIRGVGLTSIEIQRGGATTDVRSGRVYFQSPPPGSAIVAGQHVTLWVSTGPFNEDGRYLGGGSFPRP